MRKILLIFFLFSSSVLNLFATEEIKIITREEWGANESYRYRDSAEWLKIIKSYNDKPEKELTESQEYYIKREAEKDMILESNFFDEVKLVSVVTDENLHKLAWPIQKTEKVKAIVIHHTVSDYDNSVLGLRSIYKYHAISLQWGDIGYNYIIGKQGEIFEGRAGGDYVVGAHNKRNNRSTVGVAVLGDYSNKEINEKQYKSLENLIKYLVKKYSIDLDHKTYYHNDCNSTGCDIPLISYEFDAISGHRDSGHTACPGEKLYAQIDKIKDDLKKNIKFRQEIIKENPKEITLNIDKDKFFKNLENIDEYKLFNLLLKIEDVLTKETDTYKYIKTEKLRDLVIEYFNEKKQVSISEKETSYDLNNDIKIKLSYPKDDSIILRSGDKSYMISRKGKELTINGEKSLFFRLKSGNNKFIEITSWLRNPDWDTTGKYNDNKFRGDIIVYVKKNKLIVVNKLPLESYLKGLGEVSEGANNEKVETIIIAARTYSRWYMEKARKFEGKWYDGSDNPNEFQRYLGYGYEKRSPGISEIVEKTRDIILTYENEIIKPWYFNQSNGKTLSFYDYCILKNKKDYCEKEKLNYPYLLSVKDMGSIGKMLNGHGVGISGLGATYLANKGWNSEMILKYFLKGIELNNLKS